MNYRFMEFPDYFNGFDNMSTKEAGMYFEWYTSQQYGRIDMLRNYISNERGENIVLDYSPESLIPLWRWFIPRIKKRKKSIEEINEERAEIPKEFWDAIEVDCFTAMTLALIIDIGFYFAAVITRNNPSIKWGYYTKPKSRAYLKQPVLMGFTYNQVMCPCGIIEVCSYQAYENVDETSLFKVYEIWKRDI